MAVPYAVINLQGRAHMAISIARFEKQMKSWRSLDPAIKIRFVDFHAELTSEKSPWAGIWTDGRPP